MGYFGPKCWIMAGLALVMAAGDVGAADASDQFEVFKAGSTKTIDHSVWSGLLKTFVVPGPDGLNRVRYAAFKAQGQPALKGYIKSLEGTVVKDLDRPEQFAFWANLYNAKTIELVLDHYPVKSIKDVSLGGSLKSLFTGGPWKAQVTTVEGQALSLDDIEHGILRGIFEDPRVHYAVNCASNGCPNLATQALTGATLDAMLDAGARAYINHPRGVRVEKGDVVASSIYDWFKADFGGNAEGVLAHWRKYANQPLKRELEGMSKISRFDYDWNLNDAK